MLKGRLDYVKRFIESDETAIDDLANSTLEGCPFCPSSLETKAPKFIPEISHEGRILARVKPYAFQFFAHEDHNVVVVPTRSHRVPLNQIQPAMFADAFNACIDIFADSTLGNPQ